MKAYACVKLYLDLTLAMLLANVLLDFRHVANGPTEI